MRYFGILLFFISLACYSCSGGSDTVPKFNFKTQSGYTYTDDTVPVNTSIKFGINAEKTGSKLKVYSITVQYDGAAAIQPQPSYYPTGNEQKEFSRDTTIITSNTPGIEEWIFNVKDKNGNSSTRRIRLKVE